MAFIIKRGDRYMKRSYDSENGMWSAYAEQAKRWKTRKGVNAFYDRFISIWQITGGAPVIVEINDE